MKKLMFVLLLSFMIGCSYGNVEVVDAEIILVEIEPTKWGCVGTDIRTVVHLSNGHISSLCGSYGETGQNFKGYWVSGHWDAMQNGFKLTN